MQKFFIELIIFWVGKKTFLQKIIIPPLFIPRESYLKEEKRCYNEQI